MGGNNSKPAPAKIAPKRIQKPSECCLSQQDLNTLRSYFMNNSDGKGMTCNEFIRLYICSNPTVDPRDAELCGRRTFLAADTNNTGRLTFQEYLTAYILSTSSRVSPYLRTLDSYYDNNNNNNNNNSNSDTSDDYYYDQYEMDSRRKSLSQNKNYYVKLNLKYSPINSQRYQQLEFVQ
jgi:hypothetical protein